MNGVMLAIVWLVAYKVEDISQVANMMAFMQYALQVIMSFMMISMIFIILPRAIVSIKRVSEVLSMNISIKNAEGKEEPTGVRFKGDVRFENVSYGYGGGVNAVENITFEAKR